MGVFRYHEQHVPHFVSYLRVDSGQFRFFNVCDSLEDGILTMEEFVRGRCVGGPVRLLFYMD